MQTQADRNPQNRNQMPAAKPLKLKQFQATPHTIPSAITQYFLPERYTFAERFKQWSQKQVQQYNLQATQSQVVYLPSLIAQARVQYSHPNSPVPPQTVLSYRVSDVPYSGAIQWERWRAQAYDPKRISPKPYQEALYNEPQPTLLDEKLIQSLRPQFMEYVHAATRLQVPALPDMGLFAHPQETLPQFRARALQIAEQQRDAEVQQLHRTYTDRLEHIQAEYRRVAQRVDAQTSDDSGDDWVGWGETVLHFVRGHLLRGFFDYVQTQGKSRKTDPATMIKSSEHAEAQAEIERLEKRYHEEALAIHHKWMQLATNIREETLVPNRDAIFLELFGLGWQPAYLVHVDGRQVVLPA